MTVQDHQLSFFPPVPMRLKKPDGQKPSVALQMKEAEAIEHFEAWWKAHVWLKRGIEGARKAYIKAVRTGRVTPQQLAEGADRYAEYLRRNPSAWVKWPQGWINDGRFDDDLTVDDRGSAERARSSAHLGAARLFSGRAGLR